MLIASLDITLNYRNFERSWLLRGHTGASGRQWIVHSRTCIMPTAIPKNTRQKKEVLRHLADLALRPVVSLLVKMGVTPNTLSTIGLGINGAAAIVFIVGGEIGARGDMSYIGWGGALILFAGVFDILDGQVARSRQMTSRFGAIYDSVLDRYSEMLMFLGICYYLVSHQYLLSSLFAFVAMIGSVMVSYTRARAEGVGITCDGGVMQRPERIILIGVSGLLCALTAVIYDGDAKLYLPWPRLRIAETITVFTLPMVVLAVLSNVTAINRLRDCRKKLS
jgi:CDP-diacylglycerol---glycerol-3-phosphate 3-phosphatidyltransferase